MPLPDRSRIAHLAAQGNVISVYSEMLADTYTPVSVWLTLFREQRYSFLLESVEGGARIGRYSMIGGNPYATFTARGNCWELSGPQQQQGEGDPVGALRQYMQQYRAVHTDGVPRFCGGAVGYFGYDAVRLYEDIPDKNPKEDPAHDIFFGIYRDVIVFDRFRHRMICIANMILNPDADENAIVREYEDACERIAHMQRTLRTVRADHDFHVRDAHEPVSNTSQQEYEDAVRKCKDYIRKGDIFQIVLSQRFRVDVDANAFDIYRTLRTLNPSPYMYYLCCGDYSIVGASPEMLVRVEEDRAYTRPIAGTLPRGRTQQQDEENAQTLYNDPKERAEHVMLVDLGRNDLGRVSRYGTVSVTDCMRIEKFSHVIHMVSDVEGELDPSCDCLDALFACFPAGTLSGAPKIRAMEIIDELEKVHRGIYGGALGYIDFNGTMDTCIIIRTILFSEKSAWIQAGAGIVADSVPRKEYQETRNKAKALFAAIKEGEALSRKAGDYHDSSN